MSNQQESTISERVIGLFEGPTKGPLFVAFGGIHGNEMAGVKALELVFQLLALEPQFNPGFQFRGKFIGIKGNLNAIKKGQRFLDEDLNRLWTRERIEKIQLSEHHNLNHEEKEAKEILTYVLDQIKVYQPDRLVLLDLHTTSARGGIFTVVQDNADSLQIALNLHAPIIKGMLTGLDGTILHYFRSETIGLPTVGVAFESGQHEDRLSVNRAISSIINCLRTIGCIDKEAMENRHDRILIEYSEGLPKVSELITIYKVKDPLAFQMQPGFRNFQPIKKGTVLAVDKGKAVSAGCDGMIVMPLYQKQGSDGFFLIKPLA